MTQRVCGAACRTSRDRELARDRRVRELTAFREDERKRQQEVRDRRKAAASGVTGPPVTRRHAPPSGHNTLQFPQKVLEVWDKESARSRATLARILASVAEASGLSRGTRQVPQGPTSRATLAAETASFPGSS